MQELMPIHLALLIAIPEAILFLTRRAKVKEAMSLDGGTLGRCWLGICASMVCASAFALVVPEGSRLAYRLTSWDYLGVAAAFTLGFLIRLWAVWSLGRLFTVDVASCSNHTLVDRGPYRYIRHPSYAGLVVEITAFAVSLLNWPSLLVVTVTTFLVLRTRILLEEQVLCMRLEEKYRAYRRRTWRLVPFVW